MSTWVSWSKLSGQFHKLNSWLFLSTQRPIKLFNVLHNLHFLHQSLALWLFLFVHGLICRFDLRKGLYNYVHEGSFEMFICLWQSLIVLRWPSAVDRLLNLKLKSINSVPPSSTGLVLGFEHHLTALGHLWTNHTLDILLHRFKTQVTASQVCLIHCYSVKNQLSAYQSVHRGTHFGAYLYSLQSIGT